MTRNNLRSLSVAFPTGVLTTVTGVSGSGKSSLVSQALIELVAGRLGEPAPLDGEDGDALERRPSVPHGRPDRGGHGWHHPASASGSEADRPHAAFEPRDVYRPLRSGADGFFAATPAARSRRYDAGRFSFNVPKGRMPHLHTERAS